MCECQELPALVDKEIIPPCLMFMVMVGITMLWVVAVNINWGFLPPTLDHLVLKQNAQSLSISNKP